MNRQITGRHVFITLLIFFGIIAAVNFTMARFAVANFGGTVVDNSYVASQRYNDWIAAQRAQEARGWTATATRTNAGHVRLEFTGFAPNEVTARAEHPTRKALDHEITMARTPDGFFESSGELPAGRWSMRIVAQTQGEPARFLLDIPPS